MFSGDGNLDDIDGLGLHPYSVFELGYLRVTDGADARQRHRRRARCSVDCKLVNSYVAPQ